MPPFGLQNEGLYSHSSVIPQTLRASIPHCFSITCMVASFSFPKVDFNDNSNNNNNSNNDTDNFPECEIYSQAERSWQGLCITQVMVKC